MSACVRNLLRCCLRRRILIGLALAVPLLAAAAWWVQRSPSAEASLHAARAALAKRDFDAARGHLRAYLELRPRDGAAHFLAARAARQAGLFAEAQRHLKACQRLGEMTEAIQLEWLLLRVQQGDLEEVEAILKRTIAPDHPDVLLVLEALARGYVKRQRLRDALEALGLWLGKEPDNVPALVLRGWVWQRLGNVTEALRDYRRAVEIEPDQAEGRLGLACCLACKQPHEAAGHFEAYLRQRPGEPKAVIGLARCCIDLGETARACRLLDEVLSRNGGNAEALAERGHASLAAGRASASERWLRQAVKRAPDDREALYRLIQALQAQHKTSEAEQLRERLMQLTNDLKRLDELIRAVARTPHAADLRREAGAIALRYGREQEGLNWLTGALREDPGHAPTHGVLAEFYARKGNLARAERHRRLAAGSRVRQNAGGGGPSPRSGERGYGGPGP